MGSSWNFLLLIGDLERYLDEHERYLESRDLWDLVSYHRYYTLLL